MPRLVCLFLLLAGHFAISPASAAMLPSYLVQFSGERISTDGRPDEAAWAQAPWTSDFVWIDAGDAAPLRSRAKVLYDREALHFAFEFESLAEDEEAPLDPDLPRSCEIFLDAAGDGRRYLEYAVSPEGTEHQQVWNGRLSMRQWRAEPGVVSHSAVHIAPPASGNRGTARQIVTYEISFPWSGMRSLTGKKNSRPARGAAWRANFSRVENGEFAGDYVWSPAGMYYMHQPDTFGWLVFAGEPDENPISAIDRAALKPRADVSTTWSSSEFRLFSRLYWAGFPLKDAGGGNSFAVTRTSVSLLDVNGSPLWQRTRRDGLPQFIRSVAAARGVLWVAGTGIGAGLVTVDAQGKVSPAPGFGLGPVSTGTRLYELDAARCLAVNGERFQLIENRCRPVVAAGAAILGAAGFGPDQFAVGTANGIEVYRAGGNLLRSAAISGGATALLPNSENGWPLLAAGARSGLYRLDQNGLSYHPRPLRIHFSGIFDAGSGRAWAAYKGGLALIENDSVRFFDEPLGLSGLEVKSAARAPGGSMVFAASIEWGNWYASSRRSSFLLLYREGRWRRIGLEDGLPGQVNAVFVHRGKLMIATNSGLFEMPEL